jgi:hypothetical protein
MSEPRSRLQLLHELQRLSTAHAATVVAAQSNTTPTSAELWDRYSYGELTVIADFLAADIQRLTESPIRR